ncbi:MAG: hypothetical protein ACLR8Y_15855 [Alistipes indistinctus]
MRWRIIAVSLAPPDSVQAQGSGAMVNLTSRPMKQDKPNTEVSIIYANPADETRDQQHVGWRSHPVLQEYLFRQCDQRDLP